MKCWRRQKTAVESGLSFSLSKNRHEGTFLGPIICSLGLAHGSSESPKLLVESSASVHKTCAAFRIATGCKKLSARLKP